MFGLYFGDVISLVNTVLVAAMLVFIITAAINRGKITRWGRLIALFIVAGTAISALSATRDAFMMPGALFAASGMQATVCSIAGGMIFLTGIISIFFKKQNFKRVCFFTGSALFAVQVIVIESSRIAGIL